MRMLVRSSLSEVTGLRSAGTTLDRLTLPGCGSPGGDVAGGRSSCWLRDRGDVREDRDGRGRPGPGLRYSEPSLTCAVGQPGGNVQEAVAQRFRLAGGEGLGGAGQARSRVQAVRSGAIWVSISRVWLIANSLDGKRPSPVSLACRIRSSTRAWARCRASRNANWPPSELVTNAW